MRISQKLMLLVVGSSASFLLAFVVVFLVLIAPLAHIDRERQILSGLSDASADLQVGVAQVSSLPIPMIRPQLGESIGRFNKAFETLTEITYLPSMSPALAEAVFAIGNLKSLSAESLGSWEGTVTQLETALSEPLAADPTLTVLAVLGQPAESRIPLAVYHIHSLTTTLSSVQEILTTTRLVLSKQRATVDAEVGRIRDLTLLIAVLAILIEIGLVCLLSLITTRSISRSLKALEAGIGRLAAGDLTTVFGLRSKDEFGRLAANLNAMAAQWNQSMAAIQEGAAQNNVTKDQLVASVSSATSSSVQIEANSRSIQGQMENLGQLISGALERIGSVGTSFDRFNTEIQGQNVHVEETVASVGQIASSVDRIASLAEADRVLVSELVRESVDGQEVFQEAFTKIEEIARSADQILEMAEVIESITGQTNILSLNAAIEAAHAGEFGKGFAVVADEISKLAQVSGTSSQQISRTIKSVVATIGEAVATRDETIRTFASIRSKIGVVSESAEQISANVTEVKAGTQDVLSSMEVLRSQSATISVESERIARQTEETTEAVQGVGRISQEVVANIGEIGLGLSQISVAIHQVSEDALAVGTVGEILTRSVEGFVTEAPAEKGA